MKKILVTGISMIVLGIILMSATYKHKVTLVKSMTFESNSDNVAEYIRQRIREGYTLTHLEGANDGEYDSTWIIVMEKN
jgi:uncharacterized membrane-anchored protein YitT (DUF2179 family)